MGSPLPWLPEHVEEVRLPAAFVSTVDDLFRRAHSVGPDSHHALVGIADADRPHPLEAFSPIK
jgi:hypothetical protein